MCEVIFNCVSCSSCHGYRMDPQDSNIAASGENCLGVQTQSEKSDPHSVVGNRNGDGLRSIDFLEGNDKATKSVVFSDQPGLSSSDKKTKGKGKDRPWRPGFHIPKNSGSDKTDNKRKRDLSPSSSEEGNLSGLSEASDGGSDNNNSDSFSGEDSFSESEHSSDSQANSRQSKQKRRQVEKLLSDRFDPKAKSKEAQWSLSDGQNAFVSQYFTEWLGEHTIKESILEMHPVPDHHMLTPAKLEADMVDLLHDNAKAPVKLTDASFVKVQTKVDQAMAPLSLLWVTLEDVAKSGNDKCDLKSIMQLVEQTVILLGQASVAADHNRRLSLLSSFFRDPRKASEILLKNKDLLVRKEGRTDLFGRKFYKALHKHAKGAKLSLEIRREFTKTKPKHHQGHGHSHQGQGQSRKPFQKSPAPYRRGASTASSNQKPWFKKKGDKRNRYVKRENAFQIASRVRKNKSSDSYSSMPCIEFKLNSPTIDSNESKNANLSNSIGGATSMVRSKLESSDKRSMDIKFCSSSSIGAHIAPISISRAVCAKILKPRNGPSLKGGEQFKRKRSHRSRYSRKQSVCGVSISKTKKTTRGIQTHFQSETFKPVHSVSKIQNGGYSDAINSPGEKRLHDKIGHEGRIFCNKYSADTSQISEVQMEKTPCISSKFVRSVYHQVPGCSQNC